MRAEGSAAHFPSWAPVAGVIFLATTLVFFMVIVVMVMMDAGFPSTLQFPLAAVLGLGVAGSFAFFAGDAAAKGSPHLEVFREKGIEVLLLYDRVDEWMFAHVPEFDGKPLRSVARGEIELDATQSAEEQQRQESLEKEYAEFVARVESILRESDVSRR